jgi:hypothetical protein
MTIGQAWRIVSLATLCAVLNPSVPRAHAQISDGIVKIGVLNVRR